MTLPGTRREFLSDVGRGVLTVAVGAELASALRFRGVLAEEAPARCRSVRLSRWFV
jgi:hypothetical protein